MLWIGRAAVISVPAQIDAANADDVITCLLSVVCEGPAVVIVDMTATTFCDCAWAGGLMHVFKRTRASGAEMRLVMGGPAVMRVLSLTGTDRLIDTYASLAEALIGRLIPPCGLRRVTPGRSRARLSWPA